MAKTKETIELERSIWSQTRKLGVFGCFEVTIGFNGRERVDYMTYDTKGIFRCYEVKVSKSDFHSKCKNSFVGHFNYYVMPKELYEQVKDEIPNYVGVYIDGGCIKKPKRQKLIVKSNVLMQSMIRSLYREYEVKLKSEDAMRVGLMQKEINRLESELRRQRDYNQELKNELAEVRVYNRQITEKLMEVEENG